jgi:alginate O-acetyltransferase complex protein AlgI
LINHETRLDDFVYGIKRFIIGLSKKVLIANTMASVADKIFAIPAYELSPILAWTGVITYSLQIYYDFSGYSCMAIGLGRMMGFRFPENFNYPYVSKSIREFWQRWHMTLSSWLKDYLYIPLGGSKKGSLITYRNLIIVFFICGFWHGSKLEFYYLGIIHRIFYDS